MITTIDEINNDGNYSLNCRWITKRGTSKKTKRIKISRVNKI